MEFHLFQRMSTIKEKLSLLIIRFDTTNILALWSLENSNQVTQLLLEFRTHSFLHLLSCEMREERWNERRRRWSHQIVEIIINTISVFVRESLNIIDHFTRIVRNSKLTRRRTISIKTRVFGKRILNLCINNHLLFNILHQIGIRTISNLHLIINRTE